MDTLYILTRTSGRAEMFRRMRESVKALTWPGEIVHIVHTDDPRDTYVEGDIIVRGECHGPYMGTAPYNKYCNRLLAAIPKPGWVHFIDDDDEYVEPDVFERLLDNGKASHEKMHIGKVQRWNGVIFPKSWGTQKSFQTEIFVTWSTVAQSATWWADKGGDHNYSKQLTRMTPLRWVDGVLIARCQEGKGHGVRYDSYEPMDKEQKVYIKMWQDRARLPAAKLAEMPYSEAEILEKHGYGRITFKGVDICDSRAKALSEKAV